MYKFAILWIIVLMATACNTTPAPNTKVPPPADTLHIATNIQLFEDEAEREEWRRGIVFRWLWDSTYYRDPQALIHRLDTFYGLAGKGGTLAAPPLVSSLYGYQDSIYLVEYLYPNDSACTSYPYRQQFVFDAQGHLLLQAQQITLYPLPVIPNQGNLLVGIESSCDGEGSHVLYKYENGQLINIFNTLQQEQTPITYDNNPANETVLSPPALTLSAEDTNKDGWMDVVFTGQQVWLRDDKGKVYSSKRPFKTTPIRYEFIYHSGKDVFLSKTQ